MTFPLAHTSMLRRLYLKWLEVYPDVPSGFTGGYGSPSTIDELKTIFKDDYILPRIIDSDLEKVKKVEDLYNKSSSKSSRW